MNKLLGALSVLLLVGCGGSEADVAEGPVPDDATAEETGELSARVSSYVVLRKDLRRCVSPMCGGWWVRDVNRATVREVYVSGFDFKPSGLTDEVQVKVTEASDGEVVLRGRLGPTEPRFGTRPFVVAEAYRGMPGVSVGAGEVFSTVERALGVHCVTTPCPDLRARRLHSSDSTLLHGVEVSRAARASVDARWLKHRVTDRGAVVAARVVTRGRETVLDVGQVFMRLPEPLQSCPRLQLQQCPAGRTLSWARDESRCLMPTGCVRTVSCPQIRPYCEPGYTPVVWSGGPDACPRAACDPEWVTN
ncbi:MAG: hypothetical protein INH41_27730 [Myxococcaceae bacterium]|jgi:hypothetical protein|nr:hypothetical protein [Myxococcaceae bacterium]MCA3016192.1 hypothetical protein [Myxococcaceae bacterium]